MKFKIKNYENHIEAGEYTGCIEEIFTGADNNYVCMKISIENSNVIFSTSLAFDTVLFHRFSSNYADENGEADTDNIVGSLIRFTVADKENKIEKVSRIVKIEPIMEEE